MTGERVKRRRKELGITSADLARRAGISKGYLSELEAGRANRPSAQVLQAIAHQLNTTVADLLGMPMSLVPDVSSTITPELHAVAVQLSLTDEDICVLARITYRGQRPQTEADYWYIHQTIARTIGGKTTP